MPLLDTVTDEPPLILTEGDVGEIASLYTRCADYFMLQDGEPATLTDASDLFCDVPDEKTPADQFVMGWRSGSSLMAVVAVLRDYPSDGVWYLGFMIVDPANRGQGVGRSIHGRIEQWVADHGGREIRLAVLEKNEAGERFWRSLGYRELRRVGPDKFKARSHHRIELCRHLDGNPAA